VIRSRGKRWVRHRTLVEKRNACRVLVGKPEGRRTRRRWENNIRICHGQIGLDGMDWIHLAECRDKDKWKALVNKVMNFQVP
jgi:hypothetical protein